MAPGFRIEIFATEPHVVDPVEMAFDEFGGVYVAELLDNPHDPPAGQTPLSRIKYLEDTDGDGVIDHHVVFAERLLAVEGLAPWNGGLIVTAAPDILYLKDLDGDRRADQREVLYTGFALTNVEGRVSNPRLGLDNWFYVANHSHPGRIISGRFPDAPAVNVRNREFRFHPVRGLSEASTGDTQFGQSWNQWGHWFISHNTVHLRHTVIPPGYLDRNPLLTVENTEQDVSDHGRPASRVFPVSQPQQWRIDRTAARQARYEREQPGRIERLEGFFTSSSGSTIYLGDSFPEEFVGRAFVGEGAGNLVHCDVLVPDGPTYSASRWPEKSEFLASTDSWFRPVNFSNAPDGNLYVLDYYRQYFEHPDFIPDAVKKRLGMDFRAGDTLGRIYRIVPDSTEAVRSLRASLGSASGAELVATLGHPNGWHRRTAQRLLVERRDTATIALLRHVAAEPADPTARLHALWALEGLDAMDADIVSGALGDLHPAVRESALRLAEPFLPALGDAAIDATRDADPRVALQAALTVGNLPQSAEVIEALGAVLSRNPEDPWFRVAVLSAPSEFAEPLLDWLLEDGTAIFEEVSRPKSVLLRDLAFLIAARFLAPEVGRLLEIASAAEILDLPEYRVAVLEGVAEGFSLHKGRRLTARRVVQAVELLLRDPSEPVRDVAARLAQRVELRSGIRRAILDAANPQLPVDRRLAAIRILRGGLFEDVVEVLDAVLQGPGRTAIRSEAALSIASFPGPAASAVLLAGWRRYDPAVRGAVAESLMRRRDHALALADAIEDGRVQPQLIPAVTRIRLENHPDAEVRVRVAGRLELLVDARDRVVEAHMPTLDLRSDPSRGRGAFERECASCHLRRSTRGRIGPDLSGVSNRSKETLLTSILDPSYSIEDRYRNHLLQTRDGRFLDGILVAESAATVTLRGELEDVTVLKSDVEDIRVSSVSLMPEGLEDSLSDQEIADVIAYLQAGL